MDEEKFMMISLGDSKMKGLAEVLGNKTCKRIIDYLAENIEASQKDLSDALDIPINTVEYNIKKLLSSGLVQKRKNFFWSKKGKKIVMYELSNKSIVISPRRSAAEKFKGLIPGIIVSAVGSFALWTYQKIISSSNHIAAKTAPMLAAGNKYEATLTAVKTTANTAVSSSQYSPGPLWFAFFGGAILVLFIVAIVNWRRL